MKTVSPLLAGQEFAKAEAILLRSQGYLRGTEVFYITQYWLGECSMGLGHYPAAEKYYDSAYNGSSSVETKALALEGLGRAFYFSHRYREALNYFKALRRNYPSYTNTERVLYLMYSSSAKMGDGIAAARYHAQLKERYPHSTLLQNKNIQADTTSYTPASQKKESLQPFFLQCGIFSQRDNAEKLITQLKWNGFSPFIIHKEQGKIYVLLGYYPVKEKAQKERAELKKLGYETVIKQ